jgi:ribosome biogenesis GTPase / thiamine phosphate phosphatase
MGKRAKKMRSSKSRSPRALEPNGRVTGRVGPVFMVEPFDGAATLPCVARGAGKAAVVGDQVVFSGDIDTDLADGLIEAVGPRRSELVRTNASGHRPQILAANIDAIFVVCAITPELREGLVDRYLVAASAQNLEAHLIVNKVDLLINEEERAAIKARVAGFRELGFSVSFVSCKTSEGLSEIRAALKDRCSIVVGHSGVGKTSLLNALCPDISEKVQEISLASGRGQHTTTTSALYYLPDGGELIDSPGVRSFALWGIHRDTLRDHFVEIAALAGACRFGDCQHLSEPGCAVRSALEAGEVSARRYSSYLNIRETLADATKSH